ncbi:unnamed protein product [Rotaria socialis]|uniref:Uncharacterized protein n=1 Tax=Rotaria socialis TaxID=392032 RepID=A0A820N7E8_9BILA|nr:unnamed protein product [Rotaria socialis]CAF3368256.1 unnamed protein product [Rotaria socialis]CAF3407448.1 unnamed protein product [Rotaria socialis]CAF3437109.1 unnamed protein product [Rotaria socialis]CAF3464651.1 unnamed protein product [Rotaria socialis]
MIQLASYSHSNYNFLTLVLFTLVFINISRSSVYGIISEYDYEQPSSIGDDLSYENIGNSESPIPMNPNSFYTPIDEETKSRNPWSELYHRHHARSIVTSSHYALTLPGYVIRPDQTSYVPYPAKKRTIPIELQKAFFAHGIVG